MICSASVSVVFDIVFISVIALFSIVGLFRGFFSSLLSLLGFSGSFLIAFLLRKPFSSLLDKLFNLSGKISEKVFSFISEKSSSFVSETATSGSGLESIVSSSDASIPIKNLLSVFIKNSDSMNAVTVSDYVTPKIASFLSLVLSVIILFIAIRVVLLILRLVFRKFVRKHKKIGKFDKISGFLFGFAKGLCILFLALSIISGISKIPSKTEKITETLEETKICKPFYSAVEKFINKQIEKNNS